MKINKYISFSIGLLFVLFMFVLYILNKLHYKNDGRSIAGTEALLCQVKLAFIMYYSDYKTFPDKLFVTNNTANYLYKQLQNYLVRPTLTDYWGRPLHFCVLIKIWSEGPNRKNENGEGDDLVKIIQAPKDIQKYILKSRQSRKTEKKRLKNLK